MKLPSNAAKAKMEQAVDKLMNKHGDNDAVAADPGLKAREQRQIERLGVEAQKIRDWLKEHPHERNSAMGKVRLSNRTDNESAKMATAKGVIQGYTGVAAVDEKHQIILEAQAHGTGSEQELLVPVGEALAPLCAPHHRTHG